MYHTAINNLIDVRATQAQINSHDGNDFNVFKAVGDNVCVLSV